MKGTPAVQVSGDMPCPVCVLGLDGLLGLGMFRYFRLHSNSFSVHI